MNQQEITESLIKPYIPMIAAGYAHYWSVAHMKITVEAAWNGCVNIYRDGIASSSMDVTKALDYALKYAVLRNRHLTPAKKVKLYSRKIAGQWYVDLTDIDGNIIFSTRSSSRSVAESNTIIHLRAEGWLLMNENLIPEPIDPTDYNKLWSE